MPALLLTVDPDGLLEYSVVFSDRSLNHMSRTFQQVMRDIARTLKETYRAEAAIVVPGSGTFGMEAVARQFATGKKVLVLRNGWFSYRWTQILEMGRIPAEAAVLRARRVGQGAQAPFAPAPIEEVVAAIHAGKPDLVFAAHVDTASGILLPPDYVQAVGRAVGEIGGLFVLDCVASGTLWVEMKATGVDVLITAPQKVWSGPPCCGLVMLGERARAAIEPTSSTSFAADLKRWLQIIEAYEQGGHAYHATLPTDGLRALRGVMAETVAYGLDKAETDQRELGRRVRTLLAGRGFPSVAAPGFEAPGVVVSFTTDPEIQSGRRFLGFGLQTAAGVPLQCEEGPDFRSFRIGLFGLDKLADIDRTVRHLRVALDRMGGTA